MNQIIVNAGISENRLAIVENAELVELYIERRNNKRIVGNIYKGRVVNVLPGMQAAFVDVGLEKNCFLYVKDALGQDFYNKDKEEYKDISIKDVIKQGQEIIVQVIKEPIGSKGAKVTTNITLPGRYLVLMPNSKYTGVSRKICSSEERDRLRDEIEEIRPKNMGVILRTVAKGKTKEDFKEDIKFLLKLWQKIEKEKKLGFAPRLIYKDFDLINKTVRDIFSKKIDEFIINDFEEYKSAVDLVELISPPLKNRVSYYDEKAVDVFEHYKIQSQINKSLDREIWLESGGYIVIDTTEALTVIDVNTGKYVGKTDLEDTVLKTNLEAAIEIAKQLRLRDVGGIIIIDFIDMINEEDEHKVLNTFENALSKDRTKTKVLGITNLGLVEMTRKKVRNRLDSLLQKTCVSCEGTGKILNENTILNKLEKEANRISVHTNSEAVIFEVHPTLLDALQKEEYILGEIENKTKLKLYIISNHSLHNNDLVVKSMGNMETIQKLLEKSKSK